MESYEKMEQDMCEFKKYIKLQITYATVQIC